MAGVDETLSPRVYEYVSNHSAASNPSKVAPRKGSNGVPATLADISMLPVPTELGINLSVITGNTAKAKGHTHQAQNGHDHEK
jgi:hypothetical protein